MMVGAVLLKMILFSPKGEVLKSMTVMAQLLQQEGI